MRLAIVATPPLALVTIMTLGLALRPHHKAPTPEPRIEFQSIEVVLTDPAPPCADAHELVVQGQITGGASHVQLAGPVLYTDVTTNALGKFDLRIPVEGNLCDVLQQPTSYEFEDATMTVRYTIAFE